jgi:transmembrane sensor
LGLLQLRDSPAAAAQSFSSCRRLQPGGPLAQDALAREVEAQSRAGNAAAARALAEQYLRSYPQGRRATAVKRFGGL